MKHTLSILLAITLGGCASEPKKIEPKQEPTATVWRLTFDKRLEQNDFAAPILNVDFGAETFPFYVSTASASHTIDTWAAGLTKIQVANNLMKSHVEIDDDYIADLSFNVAKQNSRFEANGVAGWLVPQLLINSQRAVAVDFFNSKFYLGKFESLLKERGAVVVSETQGNVCQGANQTPLYLLVVKIDDVPVTLLVDSVAEDTILSEGQPVAKKLSSSAKSKFTKFLNAKVNVGGKTVTRMVEIEPVTNLPCAAEGVIGMDVLKLCTLVLDQQRFGVNCITD